LDRKLRREVWTAVGRLAAITCIIAVGVACYVEMSSAHSNLTEAKERFYARCRMADFSIELKKAPVTELAELSSLPGVEAIRPRIQFYATVDVPRVEELLNGQVLSLPDRRENVINDVVLKRGSYFTQTRHNEVIVNEAFAQKHGLRPGQWIHLILNNRRQELFVVGTAISSEFVYLVGPGAISPDPEHFGVFYLKHSFAEEVFDFDGAANQVLGKLTPSHAGRPQEVLRRAERLLTSYGVFTTTPLRDQPSNRFLSEELEGLATFTLIMPSIFLTVAALVLNVMMTRWTEQQRTIVGTLKAVGYSNLQVFWHYVKFGLIIGVLGGVLGCVLGYYLAEWVTGIYSEFYVFPDMANRFYPGASLTGLAISLVCATVGALYGAWRVLRLKPAEAMRPKPPKQGGAILLERVGWFWNRLDSGWRMVLRSVIRNRVRTGAGLFSAAMGTCILVTGFMMQQAMKHLIDFQYQLVWRSDVDLIFKDERSRDALREARRLPGVEHAEPLFEVACTFVNGPISKRGAITGLDSNARLTIPRDAEGRRIKVPAAGVAMSRKLADILQVQVGDVLRIVPIKGLRQERPVPIVQIIEGYLGLSAYADIDYLNRLVNEEFAVSGVQLELAEDSRQRRGLHRELKELPGVQAVSQREDMIRNLQDTIIKTQTTFIGLLIFFAGVIFFGSVLNASLISLAERQTEVATLRVQGYGPWEIGGLFLRESMIVNLCGTLLGLPLGYRLTVVLTDLYDTEMFRIPVVFTRGIAAWTMVVAILFGLLAHGFVQLSIHRMDWLDALKVRE
jgi:putative ABC transport system permease protein